MLGKSSKNILPNGGCNGDEASLVQNKKSQKKETNPRSPEGEIHQGRRHGEV